MPTPASFSPPTDAPSGFEAVRETLSNLLLLLVIAMLTTGVERLIASLRQRTETTDLTDITRAFGTTDIALILERLTNGLQRLRTLEEKVRRAVAGLDTDPQLESTSAPASPLSLCASQPLGPAPEDISVLSLLTPELMASAPVRATGPPRPPGSVRKTQRGLSILSYRGAWPAPSCRFPSLAGRQVDTLMLVWMSADRQKAFNTEEERRTSRATEEVVMRCARSAISFSMALRGPQSSSVLKALRCHQPAQLHPSGQAPTANAIAHPSYATARRLAHRCSRSIRG